MLFESSVFSQTEVLPQNKYLEGHQLSEFLSMPKARTKGLFVSLGYQGGQFLNSQFGVLTNENLLKHNYGTTINFRKILYPIIIDIGAFMNKFSNKTSADNYAIVHEGFDGSISIAILPLIFRTSEYLVPYAGLGYLSSDLFETSNTKFSNIIFPKKDKITSEITINQPIWKVGIMVNLNPLFLNFEYKQSIKLQSNEKAINGYSASIGCRFRSKNR